jgi:fucose permease
MGLCLASLYSGIINRYLGGKISILIGVFSLMAGAFTMMYAPGFIVLLISSIVIGTGQGIINNITNSFVNNISNQRASMISLLHACYSLGCVLTPFTVWLILKNGFVWTACIRVFMVLCLFSLFLGLKMIPKEKKYDNGAATHGIMWYRERRYYLLTILLFMAIGIQNGIMGWSTTYFVEMELLTESGAQQLLAAMWVMMIVGRLACSFLAKRISRETLLLICCTGAFLLMLLSLFFVKNIWLAFLFILTGLLIAGIYPMVIASASKFLIYNTTASGFMFALSGLGGVTSTYLCGLVSEKMGMSSSITVIFIIGLIAFLIVLLNQYWAKRENSGLNS